MSAVRIIEVEELGTDAAIVRLTGGTLLLLDAGLEHDDRMMVMQNAMGQLH